MKIGIDTFAGEGGSSAVGMYLTQILKRIKSASSVQYELFGWDYDRFAYAEAAENLDFIPQCPVNGAAALTFWHLLRYNGFARHRGYGACFFPAAHKLLPRTFPSAAVGTVHDAGAYRGRPGEKTGLLMRTVLPGALRRLDRIIAVSRFVKEELSEHLRLGEDRIEVVPLGVDTDSYFPRPRTEGSPAQNQPFSFRRPYILSVSRIEHPAKNQVNLIKAFGIFKERTRHPHRLVLAGGDGYGAQRVKEAASSSLYRNDIFFPGQFPLKSLPELYGDADMVVIPSMYEDSGGGVLEAMASGVPVACAREAALPEIAGDAALYFDCRTPEDMADRMVTLSSQRDIARECRTRGLEQVKSFSWDHCAARTLEILEESAESR